MSDNSYLLSHNTCARIAVLVGECRELGDSYPHWRAHWLQGIAALLGCDLINCGLLVGVQEEKPAMQGAFGWGYENGFNLKGWQKIVEDYPGMPSEMLLHMCERTRNSPGEIHVAARQDVMSDSLWDATFDRNMVAKTIGVDHTMHSICPIGRSGEIFDAMVAARPPGKKPFGEREKAILEAIYKAIAPLIGGALASVPDPDPSKLPLRVRQVLRCLLEGDSDKQIGQRLKVSVHTVNQYTKMIYAFFHVSGRLELLARWVRRGWTLSPHKWDHPSNLSTF